jgi:hypothetical protein
MAKTPTTSAMSNPPPERVEKEKSGSTIINHPFAMMTPS